jgi:hypothetical protein
MSSDFTVRAALVTAALLIEFGYSSNGSTIEASSSSTRLVAMTGVWWRRSWTRG